MPRPADPPTNVTPRISLALVIHNHQPVGNFGWVIEEAFRQAYLPLLEALERHPRIRFALHYSGPLLGWLRRERPEFLSRLVALVGRGQVELVGGAHYEPVLVALPERDRLGQLRRMASELEALTGVPPRGAWLAERVWEPSLPSTLAAAGYRWTVLDDVHFRAAAVPDDALHGAHTTDDQGRLLTLLATDQRLRYMIPFGEPAAVIDYLRGQATDDGSHLATMGDDGEKLGSWPTTFEHCWGERRWMARFFDALEASAGWLVTVTPSEWLARHPPIGRVYVPTSSYVEMTEWALPPEESRAFTAALHRAVAERRPEARWLRGGFWRNYQARYREVNDLHKAMLRISDKVAAMPAGPARERALDHLYQGQSNDVYWHGVFGGIYITHLRLAAWEHLVAAEDAADAGARERGGVAVETRLADADLDGVEEVLVTTPSQLAVIDAAEGAGLGEWDLRAAWHAIAAVMRRRPEAAHVQLLDLAGEDRGDASPPLPSEAGATSIHELVVAKEPGLAERLHYDRHERRSGLVHLVDPETSQDDFAAARYAERGDLADRPYAVEALEPGCVRLARDGEVRPRGGDPRPLRVEKTFRFSGERLAPQVELELRVTNRSAARIETTLAVEWALNLLGGGGNPDAYYRSGATRTPHDGSGAAEGIEAIGFGNDWLGIDAEATVAPPAGAWWQPIETISNSEAGFERVYQGSALVFRWPLRLDPGEAFEARTRIAARCDRDRAGEATS